MKLSDYMRRTAQDSERASVAEILACGEVTPDRAHRLRAAIEVAAESYDDATAAEYQELYPTWDPTAVYAADARVQYQGVLYKCLQGHTAQADWTPDAAPSLWAKVLIPDPDVIPEWEQPDSTNPYMVGDRVTHNGITWESTIDNNVWEPGVVGTENLWKQVI